MKLEEILKLYDLDERQNAQLPGMRTERDGAIVRQVMEVEEDGLSFVIFSNLDEKTADAAIARQVAYFRGLRRDFEWKTFAHDRPPDLPQRLTAHGFAREDTEALLALELADAPQSLLDPPAADVVHLSDPSQLETVRRLLAAVYGGEFDWLTGRMGRYMEADIVSFYVALVDEQPASTGWVFLPEGSRFASLYGGTTLEPYRGRGCYTALLAARAQEAIRRGYQFLTVDAGEMSRPIVEKHGFRLLADTTPYLMKGLRKTNRARGS